MGIGNIALHSEMIRAFLERSGGMIVRFCELIFRLLGVFLLCKSRIIQILS